MITITYIWHDCFVITDDEATMVFDYWKDPIFDGIGEPPFLKELDKEKPLYVFVSHHHKDHFNKEIFEWGKSFNQIHYIISKDTAKHARHILRQDSIFKGYHPKYDQVTVIKAGETYEDKKISVKAFGSTDIGNSYLVSIGNCKIFHAGDLNAWLWLDESTNEEVQQALTSYREILDVIAKAAPQLDIAMFPVDSRIGREYYTGARLFLKAIDVKRFFPMHFGLGEDHEQKRYKEDAMKFQLYANPERGEYIGIGESYGRYAFVKK